MKPDDELRVRLRNRDINRIAGDTIRQSRWYPRRQLVGKRTIAISPRRSIAKKLRTAHNVDVALKGCVL